MNGNAMAPSPMPEWLDSAVGGIVLAALSAYAIFRRLKSDKVTDAISDKGLAIIGSLEAQLKAERENNAHLGQVIDRVASERNEAIQSMGQLEGVIKSLEGDVQRMRIQVDELQARNGVLAKTIETMRAESAALNLNIAQLLKTFGEKHE